MVNVKVANIRPAYDNLQKWCENPNNVYIGDKDIVLIPVRTLISSRISKSRFPREDSIWHNPFKSVFTVKQRTDANEKYKKYITEKIEKESLKDKLLKLRGKTLGCWCKPYPCHGDVLIELIKDYSSPPQ